MSRKCNYIFHGFQLLERQCVNNSDRATYITSALPSTHSKKFIPVTIEINTLDTRQGLQSSKRSQYIIFPIDIHLKLSSDRRKT